MLNHWKQKLLALGLVLLNGVTAAEVGVVMKWFSPELKLMAGSWVGFLLWMACLFFVSPARKRPQGLAPEHDLPAARWRAVGYLLACVWGGLLVTAILGDRHQYRLDWGM